MNIAIPYTAAPPTTPNPIPTEEGLTAESLEFPSPPAALSLLPLFEVLALFAEFIGLPSPTVWPAKSGIDGSSIPIRVFTVASGLLYKFDFGFSKANDNGLT